MANRTGPPVSAVGVGVVVVVAAVLMSTAPSGDLDAFYTASEQWCHGHGGELALVNSVNHGGLHCDLPNGTTVHMTEVITRD